VHYGGLMPIEGIPVNGDRLKAARRRKLLTQTRLGELVGVSSKSVSRWESGGYRIRIEHARALNIALGHDEDAQHLFTETPLPRVIDKADT
jgi:transcriptional regulator with XRE-family HTH domain